MNKFKLNSYNEWGKLHEVIIGNPFSKHDLTSDFSFCHFHFDNINEHFDSTHLAIVPTKSTVANKSFSTVHFKERYIDELTEDIEGFIHALNQFGTNVLRPKKLQADHKINLPYWETSIWPALNVRDRFLVLGDNIIETTPCIRARYLETDLLKDILYGYFTGGANWISMPKPILTDTSFDLKYINSMPYKSASRELIKMREENYYDTGLEIIMDAANCLRLGRDIIVNVADENQNLAFQWLNKAMGHKYTFYKLDSVTDNHIDSYIIIIRPGLLLLRNKYVKDKLPEFMQNWNYIIAPEAKDHVFPTYDSQDLVVTSKYIDTNILSLDENTVIANSLNIELIKELEKNKINVVPVQHRHRRLFGGGFHCFSLDTNRESEHISYR